jgi:hypothetical protein
MIRHHYGCRPVNPAISMDRFTGSSELHAAGGGHALLIMKALNRNAVSPGISECDALAL